MNDLQSEISFNVHCAFFYFFTFNNANNAKLFKERRLLKIIFLAS